MVLDQLTNVGLDGIKGYIYYNYDSFNQMIPSLLIAIGILIFIITIGVAFAGLLKTRRSKEYRQLMTDMLIVGIIKNIAVEEKVDILKELQEFSRIEKKSKIRHKQLDEVIEEEMKDKIANVQEKNLS